MRHLLKEYLGHYNSERPHQAKDNVSLPEADQEEPTVVLSPSGEIRYRERLGVLQRHYCRAVA